MGSTNAQGTYADCGYGMPVSLILTCNGPSCSSLSSSFPALICTSDATSSNCNNQVTCPGPANFVSNFTITQQGSSLTSQQHLTIDDQDFIGTDNGEGGISYSSVEGQPEAPPAGPTSTASPLPPSSNVPSISSTTNKVSSSIAIQSSSSANRRFYFTTRSSSSKLLVAMMIICAFVGHVNAQVPVSVTTSLTSWKVALMVSTIMLTTPMRVLGQACSLDGDYGVKSPAGNNP